jgi:HAE1 family hydrophobic/amphiphilic exporter-1
MQLAVEGDFDPVTLREIAQNDLSAASSACRRGRGDGQRRPAPADSHRAVEGKDHRAQPVGRPRRADAAAGNQNVPLGEVTQGDATYLVRSQGQFNNLDDIRNLVVMTRAGVPVYLRDVADVVDSHRGSPPVPAHRRQAGVRCRSTSSRREHRAVAEGIKSRIERINREVPGIRSSSRRTPSIFIERAIANVQEHALIGGSSSC